MSPNANVFIIFMISLFLSMHKFLREIWKGILVPPFLDCSQYSQVVSSSIFSTDACFQGGGIASVGFPWLAVLAERWETEFLVHLCYQLSAVSCSESEPQDIHLWTRKLDWRPPVTFSLCLWLHEVVEGLWVVGINRQQKDLGYPSLPRRNALTCCSEVKIGQLLWLRAVPSLLWT